MFFVYVLLSKKDNKLYIGQTNNLNKRLEEHSAGRVLATRSRRPLQLIHSECFNTRTKAIEKEKLYKTGRGREKLKASLKLKSRPK